MKLCAYGNRIKNSTQSAFLKPARLLVGVEGEEDVEAADAKAAERVENPARNAENPVKKERPDAAENAVNLA